VVMMPFFGIEGRAELRTIVPLRHAWGTPATVTRLRDSLPPRESRYFADFETQETPRLVGDSPRTHS
jgi:hypothetical protein